MRKSFLIFFSAFALGACKAELESATPVSSGTNIDLSRYVAVGNSLCAGYADGGLYLEGQQNSYPSFLNEQFAKTGAPATFTQPLFAPANSKGSGYLKVTGYATNPRTGLSAPIITSLGLDTIPIPITDASFAFAGSNLPLVANPKARQLLPYTETNTANQNLGIPGLAVVHVGSAGYSMLNPFFERLLTPAQKTGGGASYISYINSMTPKPTFFTCWLGNNDVLAFATGGGEKEIPTPSTIGNGAITPQSLFNSNYDLLVNTLTGNGAKGVLATVPDVTSLPYFTTIKSTDLPTIEFSAGRVDVYGGSSNGGQTLNYTFLSPIPSPIVGNPPLYLGVSASPSATQVAAYFNAIYVFNGYTSPNFVPGTNFPIIMVNDVGVGRSITNPSVVKQYNPATDFITLPFGSAAPALFRTGSGFMAGSSPKPLADKWILDASEVAKCKLATAGFNAKIKAVGLAKGLPVFDAEATFNEIIANNGIDDVVGNASFISGGLFSLDGVHLTPRGYGMIANQFIKAINAGYQANIPLLDVRQRGLRGVLLP